MNSGNETTVESWERVFSSLVKISFAQICEAFISCVFMSCAFFYPDKFAHIKTDDFLLVFTKKVRLEEASHSNKQSG